MNRHIARLLLLWLFVSQASAWAMVDRVTAAKYHYGCAVEAIVDAGASAPLSARDLSIRSLSGVEGNMGQGASFSFTGYTEDKETNLLYAKARYYDSDTGRFLSQDAWEGKTDTPPSLHKYLYAYQNPTVYTDPTGNFVVTSALNEDAEEASKIISDHIASMNTELNGELANDTAIRLGSIVEKLVGNAASLVGAVSGLADTSIDAGIGAVYGGELFGQNSRNRTNDRIDSTVGGAKSAYAFSRRDDALSVVADHVSDGMQDYAKELQSGDLNAWSGVGAGSAELLLGGIASKVSKLPKITVESTGSARGVTVPMSAVTDAEASLTAKNMNNAVIGRMEDMIDEHKSVKSGFLKPGESLVADLLPNLHNPKANYYQNMSVLRKEMRRNVPIRDGSAHRPDSELAGTDKWPNRTIRQTFTGAERNQLRNKGWSFDGEYWNPPN